MIVFLNPSPWSSWWDRGGPPIFTRRVKRSRPVSGKNECNLYWWHLGPESPGGFTTPDPSPKTTKSRKWENCSKLGIPDPIGGKRKSSFGGQLKSPFSEGKNPGFLLRKVPFHRSPYSMFNRSCRCGIPAFCSENFYMSAKTWPRISETCWGVTCVKKYLRNHFLLALRISGISLLLESRTRLAHVPVILKDTVTSALVCPLSEINKDLYTEERKYWDILQRVHQWHFCIG